jgi:TonB family protein
MVDESRVIACLIVAAVLATASCRRNSLVVERPHPSSRPDLSQCPDDFVAGVGGADEAPVVIRRVDPTFSSDARVRGVVILETVIARSGDVCAVRVLRGIDPTVDAAAMAAVRQWKFIPARKGGAPVQAVFNLTVAVPPP